MVTVGEPIEPEVWRWYYDVVGKRGKIMRRVLAAISNRLPIGDVTTLANPEVVEQIRVMVQGAAPVEVNTEVGEDIRKFGEEV